MKYEDEGGACKHCTLGRAAHQYHCLECGVATTETAPCGCGACQLPVPACACERGWALMCPAGFRTMDEERYRALMDMPEPFRMRWERAEAERLWLAQN